MADAKPPARRLLCFVQADLLFCVVLDAVNELRRAGRLKTINTVRVGNASLQSTSGGNVFSRNYDFSRTLAVNLRSFMLTATGMKKYFHPNVASEHANQIGAGYYKGAMIELTPDQRLIPDHEPKKIKERLAEEISGNFDRLHPHILIDNKIKKAGLDMEVRPPGMMLIADIDLENRAEPRVIKFHQISTTVRFTKREENDKTVFDCPEPSVVHITALLLDGEDGPDFKLFKNIIRGHLEILEREIPEIPPPEDEDEEDPDVEQIGGGLQQLKI